jgi:hypothetical protein
LAVIVEIGHRMVTLVFSQPQELEEDAQGQRLSVASAMMRTLRQRCSTWVRKTCASGFRGRAVNTLEIFGRLSTMIRKRSNVEPRIGIYYSSATQEEGVCAMPPGGLAGDPGRLFGYFGAGFTVPDSP